MKKIFLSLLLLLSLLATAQVPLPDPSRFNILFLTDLGTGIRDYNQMTPGDSANVKRQKQCADKIGEIAAKIKPRFIINTGDTFHGDGVSGADDPLWKYNYEDVYTAPAYQVKWYPCIGNHEYKGNPQGLVDYTKKSGRWTLEDRYYTKVFNIDKKTTLRIIWLDTTPITIKSAKGTIHSDENNRDYKEELTWLEQTLKNAKEDWIVVAGHHPIFADKEASHGETPAMVELVEPIFRKYGNVDLYINGHSHIFQHLVVDGKNYVMNTSGAAKARDLKHDENDTRIQFFNGQNGTTLLSFTPETLDVYMVDTAGKVLHHFTEKKN